MAGPTPAVADPTPPSALNPVPDAPELNPTEPKPVGPKKAPAESSQGSTGYFEACVWVFTVAGLLALGFDPGDTSEFGG
jgi:hypothetical protein